MRPLVDAILDGSAAVRLVLGLLAIKAGHRKLHERLMQVTFLVSTVFLANCPHDHFITQRELGPTPFRVEGWRHTAYRVLLASHVILAIVNLPMVLRVLRLAHEERWREHR